MDLICDDKRSYRKKQLLHILSTLLWVGGFFLFYVCLLGVIFKSGYLYDDALNYTTRGWCIHHDATVFDLTREIVSAWFYGNGRCFIFAFYTYFLFYLVNITTYKFLIILSTFISGLLIAKLLREITGSHKVELWILFLFPILASLDCSYYNSLYGFHMLIQFCFSFSIASIICFTKYLKSQKVRWQILSIVFLFIALGTYEVSYVLCAVFLVVAWNKNGNGLIAAFKKLLPQIVVGIGWICMNIYARVQATSAYAGTTISIGKKSIEAFFKQLTGTVAISNYKSLSTLDIGSKLESLIQENGLRYFFIIVLVCIIYFILIRMGDKIHNIGVGVSAGLLIAVLPAIIIAITEKYQNEVTWGHAYLPGFVSCWGITVCLAVLLGFLPNIKKGIIVIPHLVILTCLLTITVCNQMIADVTIENSNNGIYATNQFLEKALEIGLLDEISEDNILIEGNDSPEDISSRYAYFLNRKINAMSWRDLFIQDTNWLKTNEIYDNLKNEEFYYIYIKLNEYVLLAKCHDINIGLDNSGIIYQDLFSRSFDIYIPNDSKTTEISFTDGNGQTQVTELDAGQLKFKGDKGSIYTFNYEHSINVGGLAVN